MGIKAPYPPSPYPPKGPYDVFLKDQMTLKSRGPIPIYYESLYGI